MTGLAAAAGPNSSRSGEPAQASAEVVSWCMASGGFAARMMPEGTRTFTNPGATLFSHPTRIGQEVARFMSAAAALASRTAAILARPNLANAWFGRLATQSDALCPLALEAQGAVMAPTRPAATDKAARLRI